MVILKIVSISFHQFKIYDDFNFFKIFDEFLQNKSKCLHLKIINISKIATVDLQQITQSFFQAHEFKEKCDTILYPPF